MTGEIDAARRKIDKSPKLTDREIRYAESQRLMKKYHFASMKDNGEIYVYTGSGAYRSCESLIQEEVQGSLGMDATPRAKADIISYIQDTTRVDRTEFDRSKEWRIVKNGILNIYTRELKPHSPEFLATVAFPVEYRREVGYGPWGEFMNRSMDEENRAKLIKMLGDILIPGYPFQSIYFLVGVGGNGKGTLGRGLNAFVGIENVSGVRLQELAEDKHATADLYGKLINFAGDVNADDIKDWALIRSLSGGDLIRANGKYQKPYFFLNSAKLVFAFNQLPKVDDAYSSFRRVVLIEFNQVYTDDEKDDDLDEKLRTSEALSGLLNIALDGVQKLKDDGGYNETWQEVKERYQTLQNDAKAFLVDCMVVVSDSRVDSDRLHDRYVRWAEDKHKPVMPKNVLGTKLHDLGYQSKRSRAKGQNSHFYQGLAFKEDAGQTTL